MSTTTNTIETKKYSVVWDPDESQACEDDKSWDEEYPKFTPDQRRMIKYEYWSSEIWGDNPDYLTLPGKKLSTNLENDAIMFIEINGEIIINDIYDFLWNKQEEKEKIKKMLLDFFTNYETTWEAIWCGNHINPIEQFNWDDERYTIQYRGGKGMYYYSHQYRKIPIPIEEYKRTPISTVKYNFN